MPFAATIGLGSIRCDCLTALVLNLNGNAITLSQDLWRRGVRDAKALRQEMQNARGKKTYTFGVVFPHSSQNFLLRRWLASGGIDAIEDARVVAVPAPSMFEHLRSGNLDGYCAPEPWNSAAVQAGVGWCAATSTHLAPFHPEKVLMARREFAEEHTGEHLALIAALIEACAYCDCPENREQVIQTLARPEYVNVSIESLRGSMLGRFDYGNGRVDWLPDFHVFYRRDANEPDTEKAAWVLRHLMSHQAAADRSSVSMDHVTRVFRPDIFHQAAKLAVHARQPETTTAPALAAAP